MEDSLSNMTYAAHAYSRLNSIRAIPTNLSTILNTVDNWQDVLLFRSGIKKNVSLKLRNGRRVQIRSMKDYFGFINSEDFKKAILDSRKSQIKIENGIIEFDYGKRKMKFFYDSIDQMFNTIQLIDETFVRLAYRDINAKGKIVVDIGANVGDTAIYFALEGAKKVYAFEPFPYSYKIAKKNLALNRVGNRVVLLNQAVGMPGTVKVREGFSSIASQIPKNLKKGKEIKVLSLSNIVHQFDIDDALLKMDCEGSEYDIILNSDMLTLRSFSKIVLEYHYGYINLVEKLKSAGFRVRHTLPGVLYSEDGHKMYAGMIYAELEA